MSKVYGVAMTSSFTDRSPHVSWARPSSVARSISKKLFSLNRDSQSTEHRSERVDDLGRVPLAFRTYTGNVAYAAAAARQLDLNVEWRARSLFCLCITKGGHSPVAALFENCPSVVSR